MKEFMFGLPLSFKKNPPIDQINPTIENCPKCDCKMWVSDLKRAWRTFDKANELLCGQCLVLKIAKLSENA